MIQIQVTGQTGIKENIYLDKDPNICPYCHKSIKAQRQDGYKAHDRAEVIFRCPDDGCGRIFIAYYIPRDSKVFLYQGVSVGTVKARDFSDNIKVVSSHFIEIYNQSLIAEAHGLNHITGIGLRKALEFLIKDYLIINYPELTEVIQNKMLGLCIKDHLDNPNIKHMAERATWLGNDQTHYVKKWDNKDVHDLKALIDITLHWIEMEILTKRYKTEM